MSNEISNKAEDSAHMWAAEELRSFLAVVQTVFEAAVLSLPILSVKTIREHPTAVQEPKYRAYICGYDGDCRWTSGDPTPPGHKNRWHQLAMTNKCDFFCDLMEDVVRKHAQDSILAQKEDVDVLRRHSVLSISLPDGSTYIFDGSAAQYDRTSWLVPEDIYEENYAQSTLETGNPDVFELVREDTREMIREHEDYELWQEISARTEKLLDGLDWTKCRGKSEEKVKAEIGPQAKIAFEGVFQEVYKAYST
ncbi:hypothetical protein DE146DRAFT_740050 [Phaeosphaeria sp. MPI-PUGE-AT-0046c]|nr:hypothetical protein DE146DRAFT_740050 [Phaeosphaeria sp. MPI-PUGE-AT-0046c]